MIQSPQPKKTKAENLTGELIITEHKIHVTVAQIGARRHYSVPRAFEKAGMLKCLYTDIHACTPVAKLFHHLPVFKDMHAVKRLCDRIVNDIPPHKITSFQMLGISFALKRINEQKYSNRYHSWLRQNEAFCKRIQKCGLGNTDVIYCFNSAGYEILKQAKKEKKISILDQTIAPLAVRRRILAEEEELWSKWIITDFDTDLYMNDYEERERAEWDLADAIVCGSEYVREAIKEAGGPFEKCRVVPYGIERQPGAEKKVSNNECLNVLFAGTVNLRKGVPYLLEAARILKEKDAKVNIRIAGSIAVSDQAVAELKEFVELIGIVPRTEMNKLYSWADVLVHPSLSEGSANVCMEAMRSAVPVVTTPNSGSLIRDGIDGFIVPIRNPSILAEKIEYMLNNKGDCSNLGRNALERVSAFTPERYSDSLAMLAKELVLKNEQ